jgi:hypothetical protein
MSEERADSWPQAAVPIFPEATSYNAVSYMSGSVLLQLLF